MLQEAEGFIARILRPMSYLAAEMIPNRPADTTFEAVEEAKGNP
ncbi:hypothetical protein VARIO8X_120595 [Burkholderiales bacterium 8X]|nr:hypothetical protein VARIO8X_120595 [Burkholderiales bacterium 8X]